MQNDFSTSSKPLTTQDQDSFFAALKTALENINQNGTSGITFTAKSEHGSHLIYIGAEGEKHPFLRVRLGHATVRFDLHKDLRWNPGGIEVYIEASDLFRHRFLVTEQADGGCTQATYEHRNFGSGKPFPQGNVERVTDFVKELHERLAPFLKKTVNPRVSEPRVSGVPTKTM